MKPVKQPFNTEFFSKFLSSISCKNTIKVVVKLFQPNGVYLETTQLEKSKYKPPVKLNSYELTKTIHPSEGICIYRQCYSYAMQIMFHSLFLIPMDSKLSTLNNCYKKFWIFPVNPASITSNTEARRDFATHSALSVETTSPKRYLEP